MGLKLMLRNILKKLFYKYNGLRIKLREKESKSGVKYIYENNHSKNLLVVFSGIGGDYNYRRSLKGSTWDQLYIKDTWAGGISYYLYENGCNGPETLTSSFIEDFIKNHSYNHICSLGSSKGGLAAIYFGLKHGFDNVYSGACQYKLGNYIGIYHKEDGYYQKLMGSIPGSLGIEELNCKIEKMLDSRCGCSTKIYLLYSKHEHTYSDDIIHLINKLKKCNIEHSDQIETFTEHSMIGKYMSAFCRSHFK